MDEIGKLLHSGLGHAAHGMVAQEAISMIDAVVDRGVDLVAQRVPAASSHTDAAKQRIKEVVNQEITKLLQHSQQG